MIGRVTKVMGEELHKTSVSSDEAVQDGAGLVGRVDPGRRRRWLPILVLLLIGVLLCWLGVRVISGFVQGREEAAIETEREGAIKPPLRVKVQPHGEPIVTFDAATQKRIDLRTVVPSLTHYEDHVGAYGRVLDLANLTMLNTNYVAATSQLNTAKAHLAASQPAFERAQSHPSLVRHSCHPAVAYLAFPSPARLGVSKLLRTVGRIPCRIVADFDGCAGL